MILVECFWWCTYCTVQTRFGLESCVRYCVQYRFVVVSSIAVLANLCCFWCWCWWWCWLGQDLCEGGDLLTTYHFKSEQDAANIVAKVTNAVRYMHDRNIAVSLCLSLSVCLSLSL